jgi:hypothetical protein
MTLLDLSPEALADRLMSVPAYTAQDLGGDGFKNQPDNNDAKVILVSLETRDLIVNMLRDWR